MPLVQVTLVEGRSAERIRQLIAEVTAAVVRTLDAPAPTVRVIVSEVPAANWGVAGVPKSDAAQADTDPATRGNE